MRLAAPVQRLALIATLLASTLLPVAAIAQEAPSPETMLERWALEGLMVKSLGLLPGGDVIAGTRKGLWRVNPANRAAEPVSSDGLPAQCTEPVEFDDCLVSQLEVSPAGDIYALVGTRQLQAANGGFLIGSAGLYRGSAGGSWQLLVAPSATASGPAASVPALFINGFALGPDGAIYVIAGQSAQGGTGEECVHRSADGGATWIASYCGNEEIQDIDLVAAGPDGRTWLSAGDSFYFPSRRLYTSPDGIAPWELRQIDPNDTEGSYGIRDMTFGEDGSVYLTTVLAARGGDATQPIGLYRSENAGATWQRLTPADIADQLNHVGIAENGDILYGNGGVVWRTADDGLNWSQVAPSTDLTLNAMQVGADGHLWLGDDAWLYRTAEAVTSGPLVIPPKPVGAAVTPVPAGTTPTAAPAATAVTGDTGIVDAREACAASGGTFTVYPDGSYDCIHGPGGATATQAPEPPSATAAPSPETPVPAATTVPPAATATSISAQPATSVAATVPPTAPAPPAPPATEVPAATAAPPVATTAPPAATAATTPAPPAGNPRDEARRKCFESGGEFWERPNGDFGCRKPGTVGPTTGGTDTTGTTGSTTGQQPGGRPCAPCPPGTAGAPVIFSLGSFASRVNGPIAPTQFTLDGEYVIERIQTWHIQGSPMTGSGTIALRGDDGTLYGPWPAKAPTDRGRNTVWEATPNVTLGPGVYTIIDSDPDTWSQNADTDGRGMAAVYGRPAGSP